MKFGDKQDCVSCGEGTYGKCSDDPVCYTCYSTGVYAEWLVQAGRGDELTPSDPLK
jgi:hypothetical protein